MGFDYEFKVHARQLNRVLQWYSLYTQIVQGNIVNYYLSYFSIA